MASCDDFTFIETDQPSAQGSKPESLFSDFYKFTSGKSTDLDVQIVTALRAKHPELIVTTVPGSNCNLLQFAAAGFAQADLDEDSEPVLRWRGFVGPAHRGGQGFLAENIFFARYNYTWNSENFILYTVVVGYGTLQYILKEPRGNENPYSNSSVVSALLATIGAWLIKEEPAIYVYDGYWQRSTKLWEQVKKAKWDDVILDPKMKKAVKEVANKFFDSEEIYKEYGVPWKRGLIFHGPVGNGKTISLKALMHTLNDRKPPVVTLYVKSAPYNYNIRQVFEMARSMTPCMLVLEDIDTIVTPGTRSYFFNEVDGLESNDGILMIATTNHLDQLDPGLSQRPSRFDRKYLFPMPDKAERSLYAQYWRNKLKNKKNIEFPAKLCDAMAGITDDFSFAYLKEAFVATLLDLARNSDDDSDDEGEDVIDGSDDDESDPFAKYKIWRVFKAQVKILRREMGGEEDSQRVDPRIRADRQVGGGAAHEGIYHGSQPCVQGLEGEAGGLHRGKAPLPLGWSRESQGIASARDITHQSGSVLSPIHSFAPLPSTKLSKLNEGVWEWGSP
ncbi:P-loop containing nucleoside triphosphate hydrolase protein [Aaosphaeria arxii CBS 175.79]|uniref:P-loop containing nucleoside triphosphate hydrolase protein n=1 Tax=Aaosphaeria arxii CBS 175.79 TaxID=1450172 RepID=A0A6A5XRW1_9PLEO|nr:P-loop containing nucleoside triphosphate hydrolase protein [Aaosphaeria arxii CBS 175.79]KAF2016028.1 P-loop containing nucleoside triphosphate hydrolase protein [Aaosphaeria arxii CBS 175.79]